MPLNLPKPPAQASGLQKAAGFIKGFQMGGPLGGVAGLAGTSNPKLGALMGVAEAANDLGNQGRIGAVERRLGPTGIQQPAFGSSILEGRDAASRRIGLMNSDPLGTVGQGLEALRDPSLPDSLRQSYAQPLLELKWGLLGKRSL